VIAMNAPRVDNAPDQAEQAKIILEMHRELLAIKQETREIRHMLERGESWRNNLWRALTNFVGFVKADQGKGSYHEPANDLR
jgi:hypothetical protein